ncbi:TPA: hypothetical protein ACKPZ6_003834 [Serratia liquefaciens]
MEAEKRWENLEALRKEMGELADEIIELSEDGHYRERLIRLYDLADSVFSAKNVKRLLDELKNTEHRAAVDHEAACSLVVEVSEKDKCIADLKDRLSEWEDCKHDGAVWYDFSGRERCGKCGSDV